MKKQTISKQPPQPKKRVLYNAEWTVVAQVHNRQTGKPIGGKRTVVVNLETDEDFKNCPPNAQDIRARYEANALRPTFKTDNEFAGEVVWVEQVKVGIFKTW